MSFWSWLQNLFAPKRDVSRLSSDDIDAVAENVDLSGGPLKPGHRRRALRDRRLVPKRRVPRHFTSGKRRRIMDKAEGDRLFGRTQRTRNRQLRDLLADEEQLERYGLPLWLTESDIARALGLSLGELHFFASHRLRERVRHYVTFSLPKRSGGQRLIMAPKRRLKKIQRTLLHDLVNKLPVSEQAHGFRTDRNIKTGAELHVGKRVVVRLDLEDFFPTIHYGRVRGLLIAYGYSYPVATTLAVLMTECRRQPVSVDGQIFHVPVGARHCVQGAPTSPGIGNALLLKLDHRLDGVARASGFVYTRYADDLCFSGDALARVPALLGYVTRIVADEGFRVNRKKTQVMRQGQRQRVTGVTVNRVLGLSRQERRLLRAMAHRLSQQDDPELRQHLEGKLAYLHMLNPEQAAKLRARVL